MKNPGSVCAFLRSGGRLALRRWEKPRRHRVRRRRRNRSLVGQDEMARRAASPSPSRHRPGRRQIECAQVVGHARENLSPHRRRRRKVGSSAGATGPVSTPRSESAEAQLPKPPPPRSRNHRHPRSDCSASHAIGSWRRPKANRCSEPPGGPNFRGPKLTYRASTGDKIPFPAIDFAVETSAGN